MRTLELGSEQRDDECDGRSKVNANLDNECHQDDRERILENALARGLNCDDLINLLTMVSTSMVGDNSYTYDVDYCGRHAEGEGDKDVDGSQRAVALLASVVHHEHFESRSALRPSFPYH